MSWTDDDVADQGWSDADIAEQPKPKQSLEQILGPSDFTKAFSSTPARMLKSAMQMVGAGDYVPEGVSNAAAQGDASTLGRIAGDVVGTGGIRAGAGGLANALQRLNAAKGFAPAVARAAEAATYGAGQGAITSPDQQAEAAKWGAAGGAAGQALGRVVGGVVRPTAEAQELAARGVALTPGQSAGVGSLANRVEQWAASNPIAAVPTRAAQRRAVEESNLAAAQAVTDIVGNKTKLGTPPREAVEQARDIVGKTYDMALSGIKTDPITVRKGLEQSFDSIVEGNPMMTEKGFRQLREYVSARLGTIADKGSTLDGPGLKQIDSEIGGHIRRLKASTTAEEKVNAGAWMDLQQSLRETLASLAGPGNAEKLNQANAAYRQLLAIEKAMGSEAVATPRRLRQALDKAGIRDQPLNQISGAMEKTLPNTLPDSGTAERLIANALPSLLVGGGVGAQNMGWDTVGAGMMAAGALGSRTGSRFLTGNMSGQKALAEALRRTVPAATRSEND